MSETDPLHALQKWQRRHHWLIAALFVVVVVVAALLVHDHFFVPRSVL